VLRYRLSYTPHVFEGCYAVQGWRSFSSYASALYAQADG
jgi:hypothetical protein